MFLAYDKVMFNQWDLYRKYADVVPGNESLKLAFALLATSQGDETVHDLNHALRKLLVTENRLPLEYHLFAVRSLNGDTFDVYLVDEDSRFIAVAANVAEDRVVEEGKTL